MRLPDSRCRLFPVNSHNISTGWPTRRCGLTAKNRFRCWLCSVAFIAAGCALPTGGGFGGGQLGTFESAAARAKFSKASKDVKAPSKLHSAYAKWQEQVGQLVEARKSYELVLGHDPKSVDAILGLARLDHLAGRHNEAEQRLHKALKLKPNDPHVLDAAGQFYAAQERWKEAVEVLRQAMMAAPEVSSYRYHLAVALACSGDVEGSMPHFMKTVGNAEAHYNVGYILYEQGKLKAAEQQLSQALLKRPDLNVAQVMLNEVHREQKQQMLASNTPDTVPQVENPLEKSFGSNLSIDAHSWPMQQASRQTTRVASGAQKPTVWQAGPNTASGPTACTPTGFSPTVFSPTGSGSHWANQRPVTNLGQVGSVTEEQREQWKNQAGSAGCR